MAKKKEDTVPEVGVAGSPAPDVEAAAPRLLTLSEALEFQRKFWIESDAESAEAVPKRVRKVRRM